MNTVSLTLNEIFDLAKKTLLANGCDDEGVPGDHEQPARAV